ncbi:MAG: T9SS type A sorting domain-containing protein [Bacteroidales bacterium]|nr:T9SS type A sorting domain-containing protein [Bacteroidales bacterium]
MNVKHLLFGLCMVLAINVSAQVPTNWFIDTPSPGDISLAPNTEFFTEGVQSCRLTLYTANVPYFISDNFAVNMGADYTFSLDVLDNDSRGRLKIYADFYDVDGNDIYGEAPIYTEDNPDWQTITWSAVVPDGAVFGYVWIKFYDTDGFIDEAIAYVDNASFVESGGTNVVVNGGYESWSTLAMDNAYWIDETSLDVRYNGNIETVDAADFMLGGTASITFSGAEIDADDATLVHLSGASENMTFDLTVDELSQNGMETPVSLYAGMASIAHTNAANPDGVMDVDISATFHGIISAHDAYNNVWVQDAAGAYNGVMIFSYSFQEEVAVGDEVIFTAKRDVYFDLNELASPILIQIVSTGNTPYEPTSIMGADINNTLPAGSESAEKWEGQLVVIHNALVTEYNADEFYYLCSDDDGTTQFRIGDNVDYQLANTVLTVGEVYRIVGVVDFSFGIYRLNPRGADDITNTTGFTEHTQPSLAIYPNPANETIHLVTENAIENYRITDINGSLIMESKLNGISNSINVADLRAGIYFVSVQTKNETLTSRVLIK